MTTQRTSPAAPAGTPRTISYDLTYTVVAVSKLDAILKAGQMFRTAIRGVEMVSAIEKLPGWWEVTWTVEEDLGSPEPEWPGDLPNPDHAPDATAESEYATYWNGRP